MAKLSTKLIERSRPRSKKYEISCSQVRGLTLRVLPSGKKVFFFRQRTHRKDNKIRLGLFGEITLEEAKEQAARLAVLGRIPAPETSTSESLCTSTTPTLFSELAREFMRRHVETDALRDKTRWYYKKAVRDFLALWGKRPLESIRFADVEEFHRSRSERPSSANNAVRVLHVMFEKAGQWDLFDGRNPAHGIKLFPETKRKRYLSAAERRRLEAVLVEALRPWAANGERVTPRARWSHVYAIRLLLLTGFRKGEVLDLEWSWISRERLEIVLPDSKTGQSVRPISPAVLRVLEELEEYRVDGVPYVVYGRRNQRIHDWSLGATWQRLRRAADINDVRIHDLRHSAASAAISAGCTLALVGKLLGHKTPNTTARYAHLSAEAGQKAARLMTDAIESALADETPPRQKSKPRKRKKPAK